MPTSSWRWAAILGGLLAWTAFASRGPGQTDSPPDPTAWGGDHVGQSPPDYLTGDECLFCHRDIGPQWPENAHQLTMRPAAATEPAMKLLAAAADGQPFLQDVRYLLGSRRQVRFLKKSPAYGKLELLTAAYLPAEDGESERLTQHGKWHWDTTTFADNCAGCHATAVDPQTRSFSAISLDCYVCHGNVDLQHTKDVSKVLLSQTNRPPREVISICAQCHLRGGRSSSSGLAYPNNFIAGDNLLRDFKVDLSASAIEAQPPSQRHIFQNARDVLYLGQSLDCTSCHRVHENDSEQHKSLGDASLCATCHVAGTGNSSLRPEYVRLRGTRQRNATCGH